MEKNLHENIKIEQKLHTEIIIKNETVGEFTEDDKNSSWDSNGQTFNHFQKSHEKSFSCDVCGKAFSYLSYLIVHKRTHTGDKPFSCDVCGKTFNVQSSLTIHNRVHTGEKPFACNVCGKTFSNSSNLILHNRIHTGEKPFSCDVCGKTFNQQSNLIIHKRTHTGEKPFSCDACVKTFTTKYNLDKHKQIHGSLELNNTKELIKDAVKSEPLTVMSEELIKHETELNTELIIKEEACEGDSMDDSINEIELSHIKSEQQ